MSYITRHLMKNVHNKWIARFICFYFQGVRLIRTLITYFCSKFYVIGHGTASHYEQKTLSL